MCRLNNLENTANVIESLCQQVHSILKWNIQARTLI